MKIYNFKNIGVSMQSVFIVMIILTIGLLYVSCSGSEQDKKAAPREITRSAEEISDSSMDFSGNIAQTTCLECHPAIQDGGFNIDFTKVKEAGMARGRNMDVDKETVKQSEKK